MNTDTKIGSNCMLNTNSSIDHDCIINDHSHISPGLQLQAMLGLKKLLDRVGSKKCQNCIIGDNVFVAAGAVITKNVKSNSLVKGIPTKYAKKLAKF